MRVVSFNVQNLIAGKPGEPLSGAVDRDEEGDAKRGAGSLDRIDRQLTAAVLAEADADVVALQEVLDQATLDRFHDDFLLPAGMAPYPHRICLPGNDGAGLDVAVMSRHQPDEVASHAAVTAAELAIEGPPGERIFRRDCLMVRIGRLTLWVCHFKAPYPDAAASWRTRHREALAVRRLIERKFRDPRQALWLVLGDLNDPDGAAPDARPQEARATGPLREGFSVDLVQRLPEEERWSRFDRATGTYGCPDVLLASPALAQGWPGAVPRLLRMGLAREAGAGCARRLPGVGEHRPHASDHAALLVEFEGL